MFKELDKLLPIKTVKTETLTNFKDENEIQVTWIGHATVYVQMEGLNILTDPIFEEYCGPDLASVTGFGLFAYWRYREAACQIQDIHNLDAVVISHNHFDHLCKKSVKNIIECHANIKWFVPKGLKSWFEKLGCNKTVLRNVIELEWWQASTIDVKGKKFRFVFTPAQHWCQRGPLDLNQVICVIHTEHNISQMLLFGNVKRP